MAWWHRTDEGSTSALGLIIAAATFGLAFTAANLMVAEPAGVDHSSAQLDRTAASSLEIIVSQSGRAAGGGAWTADADLMDRFGLAQPGKENFLDYAKIKSMRNGTMTSADNNAPDYDDVRAAMGIDDRDFHLRTYPVIPGLDDPRWTKDPRGRFAYVGHDQGSATPSGQAFVSAATATSGNRMNVSVLVRNEGPTDYLFAVTIGLGKQSTNSVLVEEERHTRLLAPGASQTVWVDFPRMSYSTAPDGVRVTVADAAGRIIYDPTWTSATNPTSGTTHAVGVKLTAGQRFYVPTQQLAFHADRYDGAGEIPNEQVNWRFVLVKPDGSEINTTLELKKRKSATYTCTTCTAVGEYNGYFYNADMTLRAHDVVMVLASAPSSGPPVYSGVAGKEISLVGQLVTNFNPSTYSATTDPQGDVFDDANKVRDLPPLLSRYTTLIIGSGVEQNALNSADIKWAIADWVIAGGNLIVLGRDEGHANWLQPVYKASIASASGGIGAPDPTHPILVTPNKLDYQRYSDNGLAWGIREDQPFTHVLTRGSSGDERQDALAIADPGAYNDGSVVLTSYMPGALTTPQDDQEALRFLHNLMSQSYNMLFMDYGPPIPDKTPVGSAQRLAAVAHPAVPGAVVEVRIVMYAWS